MDINKNIVNITKLEFVEDPISVITLKTDNIDTYFAGESKILVHSEFEVQPDE
jgi:hypothetical protein